MNGRYMKNTSKPWRVSEDKIAEFTEEIKERPMGETVT